MHVCDELCLVYTCVMLCVRACVRVCAFFLRRHKCAMSDDTLFVRARALVMSHSGDGIVRVSSRVCVCDVAGVR